MTPDTRHLVSWDGLWSWLESSATASPALSDWEGELGELRAAWLVEGRLGDLAAIDLLRRAAGLQQLVDQESDRFPALAPTWGRDLSASLAGLFGVRDLEALAELARPEAPAALRARVYDLRWLLLRSVESAALAQEAYLEVAGQADLAQPAQAFAGGDALLRAVCLAQECGDTSGVEGSLARALPRARQATQPIVLHRVLQTAQRLPGPNRVALADLSIARAETELARREFRWGRVFYGHAERALAAAGRENESQTLGVVRASVLAEEARYRKHKGEPNWVAVSFYRRAIDELGRIAGTAQMSADLAREGRLPDPGPGGPPGAEDEGGRFAAVVEDVLGALNEVAPLRRAHLFAALPIEPMGTGPLPDGTALLEQFQSRFRARARGRFHASAPSPNGRPEPGSAAEAQAVGTWLQTSRAWLSPIIDALRRQDAGRERERSAALAQLFGDSASEIAERRVVLEHGVTACWEGDAARGLGILVPQLATLRVSVSVHRLLESHAPLALVDAALLHHPAGLGLASVDSGLRNARETTSQAAANLVLWWTLCLSALVADRGASNGRG